MSQAAERDLEEACRRNWCTYRFWSCNRLSDTPPLHQLGELLRGVRSPAPHTSTQAIGRDEDPIHASMRSCWRVLVVFSASVESYPPVCFATLRRSYKVQAYVYLQLFVFLALIGLPTHPKYADSVHTHERVWLKRVSAGVCLSDQAKHRKPKQGLN